MFAVCNKYKTSEIIPQLWICYYITHILNCYITNIDEQHITNL